MEGCKSLAEAKRDFAAATDRLRPSVIMQDHPGKSVALSALAGAAAGLSGRRALGLVFPLLDFAGLALRLLAKK